MFILFTFIPACAIFVSYLSYELFEKKLLRLKIKYSTVPGAGTAANEKIEMAGIVPAATK